MRRILFVLLLTLLVGAGAAPAALASDEAYGAAGAQLSTEWTLDEMLRYALEDERLAQAEYEAIMMRFDVTRPFSNIARAEVGHEEAVLGLYRLLELDVPEVDATEHVIVPDTLAETFTIGVQAEIDNIAMYDRFLSQDLPDEVRSVFEALRDASQHHLAAFERGLDRNPDRSGFGRSGRSGANR